MATIDLTRGVPLGLNAEDLDRTAVLRRTVDFSVERNGTGGNITANDVLQLFDVPAGFRVSKVWWNVTKAEGAAATAQLGDGGDVDGYTVTAINLNATGMGEMLLEATADGGNAGVHDVTWKGYTRGKLYTADDTVDLTVATGSNLALAVIEVAVELVQLIKQPALR